MATRLSDHDMAVAAAYASGRTYSAPPQQQQRKPRARSVRAPVPEEEEGNLPNIDDLQVAAGAAAGKKDPVWPVLRKALGEEVSSDEEDEAEGTKAETNAEEVDAEMKEAAAEAESEEESSEAVSSDTSSSSSDEELIDTAAASLPARQIDQHVGVRLQVDSSGHVKLQLAVSALNRSADDVEELRAELDRMEYGGEEADDAQMEEGILPPAVEPLHIEILPSDVLLPVGRISAVVGPTIVVQVPENGRAVSEGTPLCLGNRAPVGEVEDVFGPVMEPLYSLRYACGPTMPSEIAVGTEIFCIQRLTEYILPQELYVKGYDKADDDAESDADEDEEVEEFEFSDDDSEAVWHRKQRAAEPPKRKMPPSGPSSAMHTGNERGRGRSQRGRFDGQARGQGRGRMQSNAGNERRRGRSRGNGRGEGTPWGGGRAGRSAPLQNSQGQHNHGHNGLKQQFVGHANQEMALQRSEQQPMYTEQPQNGQHAYMAQQQQHHRGQMPYNGGQYQQQQQQQQQQPIEHHQAPSHFAQVSMQGGQYMHSPPDGQPSQGTWNQQGPIQQRGMQGTTQMPQSMDRSYTPTEMHAQPRNPQQHSFFHPQGQQQQQHVMHASLQGHQEHAMSTPYQGQQHYQQQPYQQAFHQGRQQQQQQYQQPPYQGQQQHQQQPAAPVYYNNSVSPQMPQMQSQGFAEPTSGGGMSSPATNAYLARLHGRPSNTGNRQR